MPYTLSMNALIDGNTGLYDGQHILIDSYLHYAVHRQTLTVEIPGADLLKFNTPGQSSLTAYADGQYALIENADGMVPYRPLADLVVQVGAITIVPQNYETLDQSWPIANKNIFVFKGDDGLTELIQEVDRTTGVVKFYMLCFNEKYRDDPYYNLLWATPFLNYSIPNLPSVPYNPDLREPSDPELRAYPKTRVHMLRGEQLWEINGSYYDEDLVQHEVTRLADPWIRETLLLNGQPVREPILPYVVYDPTSPYTTYGVWANIPFTNNPDYIVLPRAELELKGLLNISGEYFWTVLRYDRPKDNLTNFYTIVDKIPSDPRKVAAQTLVVTKAYNPLIPTNI